MTRRNGSGWRAAIVTLGIVALMGAWTPDAAAQLPSGGQYQPPSGQCVWSVIKGGFSNPAQCVAVILKPSLHVQNLAPQVGKAEVWCAAKYAEPDSWVTASAIEVPVVNGDATTSVTGSGTPVRLGIQANFLGPGQTLMVTCELILSTAASKGTLRRLAVASATGAAPLLPSDANWHIVDSGSTVKWTQTVTFPAPTP